MSKRKPASVKARPQPENSREGPTGHQAIVRSPKDSRLRSVAAGSTESPPERRNDSKQETPLLVENPATALQDD